MKHTHSHIPLLIFAIVVTLVVGALYGYMFQMTEVSVSHASLARDIVVGEENGQAQSKSLSTLADATSADRARLNSFFVSSDTAVNFITNLESLGTQSGSVLSIASIDTDVSAGAAPGIIGHIHAHLSAHGSWASVMRLLDFTENMPYATSVSHVQLSSNNSSIKSASLWSITFDVQSLLIVSAASSTTM